MIATLRGTVADRERTEVVLEVSGVGYRLTVTPATMATLSTGDEVFLHVHHHFWEADQRLYGFLDKDERLAFEGLLGAHKVGPALALAVVATHGPAELARILADDDLDALCLVPGVGKKTAQRLLVDLKSTLVLPAIDLTTNGGTAAVSGAPDALGDVRLALSELGYGPEEITLAVAGLPTDADSGELLKQALRTLAGA